MTAFFVEAQPDRPQKLGVPRVLWERFTDEWATRDGGLGFVAAHD